ncbi:retrograde regulation protein 2, partial [Elasticomyces elasticus]
MLPKEEEGRVGAMGVASSLAEVKGLVMDLGGGSMQLTWMIKTRDGQVVLPDRGAVSMPFGAAALTRRLAEARRGGQKAVKALGDEIKSSVTEAYASLDVPDELERKARTEGGFALYLSGGGF